MRKLTGNGGFWFVKKEKARVSRHLDERIGVRLFFRLVARRYERASIVLTSNRGFVDWGEIFSDPVLATAILDQLLHHSTTINIKGESYRLKKKRKAGLLSPPKEPLPAEAG